MVQYYLLRDSRHLLFDLSYRRNVSAPSERDIAVPASTVPASTVYGIDERVGGEMVYPFFCRGFFVWGRQHYLSFRNSSGAGKESLH